MPMPHAPNPARTFDHTRRYRKLRALLLTIVVVDAILALAVLGAYKLMHVPQEHTSLTFYPNPPQVQYEEPMSTPLREQILWHRDAAPNAVYRVEGGAYLNDLHATPGAISGLTAAQLYDPHFRTGSVRDVTHAMKLRSCAEYGIARADCTGATYEIDHLISLELGGSNDLANLWPEPYAPKPGAREKDQVEDYLHREVCRGAMTLAQAQLAISTDWFQVYYGLHPVAPASAAGELLPGHGLREVPLG